ncbi:MAG: hypothetical protein UZ08_BCD001002069 [Candidatus Parvibacillus calidus]|nr:MAG: hypothetical protein UZ08_BCD001002069 [Candidatus Parvibacillus calidus]
MKKNYIFYFFDCKSFFYPVINLVKYLVVKKLK